jgi:hypothetical protein
MSGELEENAGLKPCPTWESRRTTHPSRSKEAPEQQPGNDGEHDSAISPTRRADRERAEPLPTPFDDAEDPGRRADAGCQREDCHQRECGRAAQGSGRVPHIGEHVAEESHGAIRFVARGVHDAPSTVDRQVNG